MKKLSICIVMILIPLLSFGLVRWSKDISDGVLAGIKSCITVIIPSLYGFLILSGFLVRSGLYRMLSKPFYLISKYLFHIPPELFSVFLLSQVGGYPAGAKLISDLIRENKISKVQGENMMIYCFGGGPAFLAGTVGLALYRSAAVGLCVFAAVLSANIILALWGGWLLPVPETKQSKPEPVCISSKVLIDSVLSAAKSLFQICAMIVFFSILLVILKNIGVFDFILSFFCHDKSSWGLWEPWLSSLIEISNLTHIPSMRYDFLPWIAASISFGGICIIMQIGVISDHRFSLKKFFLARPVGMALSYCFMKIYMELFAVETAAISGTEHLALTESTSILPSLLLIIMTILLFSKKM